MRSQPSRKRGRDVTSVSKGSHKKVVLDYSEVDEEDSKSPVNGPAANGFPAVLSSTTTFPPAVPDNNNSGGASPAKKKKCHNNNNSSSGNGRVPPADQGNGGVIGGTTTASSSSSSSSEEDRRQLMKDAFMPWVLQTYGDAAKTKTISRRKSERIAKILRGEDRSNGADSSKFRFWVRAKGFRLGNAGDDDEDNNEEEEGSSSSQDLYVVTSTAKDELGGEEKPVYKKVAVVEEFFDIIYREHVEYMNQGGRPTANGKHAGQKRTYRAITEIYAFLPREAVTRFLMQCADCQRRGGNSAGTTTATTCPTTGVPGSPTPPASPASKPLHHHLGYNSKTGKGSTPSQLPLPMVARLAADIDLSLPLTSTLLKRAQLNGVSHHQLLGLDRAESSFCAPGSAASCSPQSMTAGCKSDEEVSVKSAGQRSNSSGVLTVKTESDPSYGMATTASSLSPNTLDGDNPSPAVKDEDDDEDDEAEDRMDSQVHDPERLKAFNMFVRLFVDENLDRMVPISRQPREKVQAIIDSCLRQFPEFGERARKRIRTYLKSCRRNKRSAADMMAAPAAVGTNPAANGAARPMPPHLTSAMAEQILAQACDNENQNAKRLRLGLEPISQPLPANLERPGCNNETGSSGLVAGQSPGAFQSPAGQDAAISPATASTNLFRPAFGPYQRSSSTTPAPTNTFGATDLSFKSSRPALTPNGPSSTSSSQNSPLPHRLSSAEQLAVRQLITGYRESAQFLLRSAEELEQLLLQPQNSH